MPTLQADVLVVGGGPAGCVLALNLAPWHRVLVLEAQPAPAGRVGESLPAAARRLLADMGLWGEFAAQGHTPCQLRRSTWGSADAAAQDALRNLDGPGWHLDRPRFDAWLRRTACRRGAALLTPVQRVRLRPDGTAGHDGQMVEVERAGQTLRIHARWVVDATGRHAGIARQMGAWRRTLDKLACGWVIGQAAPRDGGLADSELHAEPGGWWYSAALPGHQRLLAFYTDADLPAARQAHRPEALLARAAQVPALQAVLADTGFAAKSAGGYCAAQSAVLSCCAGPCWLAVGDAAYSFDPLSSQGLFNALYTGLAGAEALHHALCGTDGAAALRGYRAELSRIQACYLTHRQAWYEEEKRWPAERFWQRRHRAPCQAAHGHPGVMP